jgi:hypothetical protein
MADPARKLVSEDTVYQQYLTACGTGAAAPFWVQPRLCLLPGPDGRPVAPAGVTLDALTARSGPFAAIDEWATVEDAAHLGALDIGCLWTIVGTWRDGHRFCFSAPAGLNDSWPSPTWNDTPLDDLVFAFGPPGAFADELEVLAAHRFMDACYETLVEAALASYVPPPGGRTDDSWIDHLNAMPDYYGGPDTDEERVAWARDKMRSGLVLRWSGTAWEWRRNS